MVDLVEEMLLLAPTPQVHLVVLAVEDLTQDNLVDLEPLVKDLLEVMLNKTPTLVVEEEGQVKREILPTLLVPLEEMV